MLANCHVEHVIYKTLRYFADVHDQTSTHFEYMDRRFVSIGSRYYWRDDLEAENLSAIPDRIKKCMIYSLTWAQDPALRIGEGYTPRNFDYLVIFTQLKDMAFAHLDTLSREQQKLVIIELKMNVDYSGYDETTGEYKKSSSIDMYYNTTQRAKLDSLKPRHATISP